jgi:hypothetical protein
MRCDAKCKREGLTPHQAAACFSRRQRHVVAAVEMGTASSMGGLETSELRLAATLAAARRAARRVRGRRSAATVAYGPRPPLRHVARDGACTTAKRAPSGAVRIRRKQPTSRSILRDRRSPSGQRMARATATALSARHLPTAYLERHTSVGECQLAARAWSHRLLARASTDRSQCSHRRDRCC